MVELKVLGIGQEAVRKVFELEVVQEAVRRVFELAE